MEVVTDAQAVIGATDAAFTGALEDTLAEARAGALHRTGEYAASLLLETDDTAGVLTGGITSRLRRARAMESGADVGPRRGPHMRGNHSVQRAGDRLGEHLERRLREAR